MNEQGDNVTFSPRTSQGNYEPKYYPGFKYEVLPGTGLFDGHMVFSGHCTSGCQNWKGGYIDVSDNNQKATYAAGPVEGFQSNDPKASVRYHATYGSFKIDMKRTFGNADAPVLDDQSSSSGTTLDEAGGGGKSDKKSIFHGVVMIFVFVGLMPFGIVLLRVGHWVKWHALNQFVAMIIAFGGAGLGVATSLLYQRSRGFNTAHQIIGFIVIAFLITQFVLGWLHHRAFKRTQKTTKMAPVHVWLGRLVIVLATVNAFVYVGSDLILMREGANISQWIPAGSQAATKLHPSCHCRARVWRRHLFAGWEGRPGPNLGSASWPQRTRRNARLRP